MNKPFVRNIFSTFKKSNLLYSEIHINSLAFYKVRV